ncbi:GAF domain-containing protein [Saccharothrix hoggarensis]|uniref:GAF domain-containing protein n=1 Tax=Saccharothrix hoggarensis TaxID=913853 RepID=A0ABW3R266_9PSEU
MAERWLLIETFGGEGHEEPTVIGVGSSPKGMVPLKSVLGRGRYLDDVRALVARVVASEQPTETTSADGRRRMIGLPLVTFAGRVHGVYAWLGGLDEQPPPRDPAGAWYFNLTTDKIGGSDDLLDLYGVAPEDRRTQRATAEAFGRLVTNADESAALATIVRSKPGSEHQATWTVRRDDGELRAANFACRAVEEITAEGRREVVLRGITHDIGPAEATPSAPPPRPVVLAQQVLAAAREPGKHRAVVNLRNLTLLRWLDDPMPGVAWELDVERPPGLHPDDLAVAKELSQGLATSGRVESVLRLRSTTGDWMPVHVVANLMLLDQHTTAALVTLSNPATRTD